MGEQHYLIRFDDAPAAEASAYAEELREALLDADEEVQAGIIREDANKQDFGTILSITLSAPAVIAIAKAIGNWMKLRNSASISIQTKDGKMVAKNLHGKDAAKLAEMFLDGDD